MSVAKLALRICTVEALRGCTSVKNNVLDSQIGAIDVGADYNLRTDQEKPFISVYTEGSKALLQTGRSLLQNGSADLLIESGIAASMTEADPDTDESVIVGGIPATDQAFELFLDALDREIVVALTDPENVWAEIWRGLISDISQIERKRLSDATTGARIAAHQIWIMCNLLPDPVFGEDLASTSVWQKLLNQLESVGHPYLEPMKKMLGLGLNELAHERQRRRFGLTLNEARALCDMPPMGLEDTEPVTTQITHEKI